MPKLSRHTGIIHFHGLDAELAVALMDAVERAGCTLVRSWNGVSPQKAQLVFCSCEAGILEEALQQFRGLPVVVVSRLPDVRGWLDALESGAADYIAAPFEPIQIRWLFDSHRIPGTERTGAAAA